MSEQEIQEALEYCDHIVLNNKLRTATSNQAPEWQEYLENIAEAYRQKCVELTMVKKIASELYDAVNTSEGRLEAMKHYEELKAREE